MKYIIGIDASRCRSGGAYAHLQGILFNLNPQDFDIKEIHIWSFKKLLDTLPNESWLIKHSDSKLESGLFKQLVWQAFCLPKELAANKCSLLFTADASSICQYSPQIVLSQDLLAYEPNILNKYKWGKEKIRLKLIYWIQNLSFKRAVGVIFLTRYAQNIIQNSCGELSRSVIIPHGVGEVFHNIAINDFSQKKNHTHIRCLYISNTLLYKHQWNVVKAVELLRNESFDITLKLVGGGSGEAQILLENQIKKSDPNGQFIEQIEFIPNNDLIAYYENSDIFIFASSCEAFGITLLEAMSSGIPIACSDRSCLPELLLDGGVYFDPEIPESISDAIRQLILNPELRRTISKKSKKISSLYSWSRCSKETFLFINDILKNSI